MKTLILLLALGACAPIVVFADDPKSEEFIRPFPIVAIPPNAKDWQKSAARQIADAIGVRTVSEMNHNPCCCVWIEVSGWTPNPGEPGYFIINQGGGSIISASNEEQLRAAVKRFTESIRRDSTGAQVPSGMLTNYHVVPSPATQPATQP
jgi:hypothetical protein